MLVYKVHLFDVFALSAVWWYQPSEVKKGFVKKGYGRKLLSGTLLDLIGMLVSCKNLCTLHGVNKLCHEHSRLFFRCFVSVSRIFVHTVGLIADQLVHLSLSPC